MTAASQSTMATNLDALPEPVRSTIQAARRTVRSVAPEAREVPYASKPPASRSAMWKLARYALDEDDVVGIGAFARHASLYFYRGRELDDVSGLLEGGGKSMRFVRLLSPADASSAAVKRLLRRAFQLVHREASSGIASRRSSIEGRWTIPGAAGGGYD
jgi:hypothetical protein